MKSIVLSGVVASLLVFSGCSNKKPMVDEKPPVAKKQTSQHAQKAEEVAAVETETVASEDSMVNSGSNSGSELSLYENQEKLASVYFDFDRFSIKADMKKHISAGSEVLNSSATDYTVKLEGNCDEWGSDEYNFALGLKRADTVKKELIANGVASSRIVMVSYGESNPTCEDKTDECWAKNRRVDFSLLP